MLGCCGVNKKLGNVEAKTCDEVQYDSPLTTTKSVKPEACYILEGTDKLLLYLHLVLYCQAHQNQRNQELQGRFCGVLVA
jgi:hypothetical protein